MKKILIIEDELLYMKILQDELNLRGYEVLLAKDRKVGLKVALKKQPDLILLDIRMPVMDGMAMLSELRKDAYGAKVPVILLTNLEPDAGIIQKVLKSQPTYYLIKSDIQLNELVDRIEKTFLENQKKIS